MCVASFALRKEENLRFFSVFATLLCFETDIATTMRWGVRCLALRKKFTRPAIERSLVVPQTYSDRFSNSFISLMLQFSVFFHISSRILVFKLLVIPIFMLEEYSVSVLFYIFKLRSASLRTPIAKRKYRFRLLIIKMHNDLFRRRNTVLVDWVDKHFSRN